jgi:hypothetical protein
MSGFGFAVAAPERVGIRVGRSEGTPHRENSLFSGAILATPCRSARSPGQGCRRGYGRWFLPRGQHGLRLQ